MLAKSKLNRIKWHGYKSWRIYDILNEKDEYEKMKENVRNISGKLKKEKQKNSVNLRITIL